MVFVRKWVVYLLLIVLFMVGFFHRFMPATLAESLSRELALGAGTLGGLASMHFWGYTFAQVPAGYLVDRFGVRLSAGFGGMLMAFGAMLFALSSALPLLFAAPVIVAVGMAAVFVSLMKYNIAWFPARQFGLITGVSILLGSFGSVLAESPAAYALSLITWRELLGILASLSVMATIGIFLWCLESPETHRSGRWRMNRRTGVRRLQAPAHASRRAVFGNRRLWLLLIALSASNGTLYAFLGLWGVPLLTESFGMSTAEASHYATLAMLVYSPGSLILGLISDRMGRRVIFIQFTAVCGALGWTGLALFDWSPGWLPLLCYLLLGLSGTQLVVVFSATRESVAREHAGLAMSLVNAGPFLCTALTQYGLGAILEWSVRLSAEGSPGLVDYQRALWLPLFASFAGLFAAMRLRDGDARQPQRYSED